MERTNSHLSPAAGLDMLGGESDERKALKEMSRCEKLIPCYFISIIHPPSYVSGLSTAIIGNRITADRLVIVSR